METQNLQGVLGAAVRTPFCSLKQGKKLVSKCLGPGSSLCLYSQTGTAEVKSLFIGEPYLACLVLTHLKIYWKHLETKIPDIRKKWTCDFS